MRVPGFIPPIATPFRNGRLDVGSLERVVGFVGPAVSGFLVGGSVGEHPSLSLEERIEFVQAVASYKRPAHMLVASAASSARQKRGCPCVHSTPSGAPRCSRRYEGVGMRAMPEWSTGQRGGQDGTIYRSRGAGAGPVKAPACQAMCRGWWRHNPFLTYL